LGIYNTPVYFGFTDEAPHALVCGVSGSGKTELMKTILYQLMQNRTPAELGIAVADPKGDFEHLQDQEHLLFQPAHDFEDIHRLIDLFHTEYARRQEHNVRDERRWVLLVDEADQENVLRNSVNNEKINDIVLRGRSLRMNVIIGTHIPDVSSLGDIGGGLTNRWLGLTSNARESGAIQGGLALHKLGGKGDFYSVSGGQRIRFQAAMTTSRQWDALTYIPGIEHVREARAAPPVNHLNIDDITNPAHRPKIEADPYTVGFYLFHGINKVTQAVAKDVLGLTRTGHEVNRDFARKVSRAYQALARGAA
jgi:DNA segregation ATPase FtsK/SpoIIIE-like protein